MQANLSSAIPVQIEDKRLRKSLVLPVTERVAQIVKMPSGSKRYWPSMLRGEGERPSERNAPDGTEEALKRIGLKKIHPNDTRRLFLFKFCVSPATKTRWQALRAAEPPRPV